MKDKETSNGTTAGYYELPEHATELQHLIAHKNMNAQMGEIFRANYRYGEVAHSDILRDIRKIIFYANSELDRLLRLAPASNIKVQEGERYKTDARPVIISHFHFPSSGVIG